MNRKEAKRILEVYRPGGQDGATPEFVDALSTANADPELNDWFADQLTFDRLVSQTLRRQSVPADLKRSILEDVRRPSLRSWWRKPATLALAASLIGLLIVTRLATDAHESTFADWRLNLIGQSWQENNHVDFSSRDPSQIRLYIKHGGLAGDVHIPAGLESASAIGCRILECQGHKVAFLCLADGPRHTHLFISDRVRTADAPAEDNPQFEHCEGWSTVSWSAGDKTYVVVGMNYFSFVRKFRKAGHWSWMEAAARG